MGNSGGKVPQYEVVEHHQQASTSSASETPHPSAGSFSPPSQGLLRPPSPNRQQWAPVQQAPPPLLPNGWDFHIDPATGYPYFYNTRTGVSQWQDPRGPGFALPDRSDAINLGQRRQVIPPWEGGPIAADPLSWPLPPGWQEQQDQATNQRYYVNYDARIVSYNDPRLEIAKAYAQGPVVEGVPVNYPPPVIGRPVDEQLQPFEYGPLNPVSGRPPSGQGGTSYLPPPPPLKRKKNSLWSKLGYRHEMRKPGFRSGSFPGVFLLGNPEVTGIGSDSSSSSSSSSDNDDSQSDEGDDLEAGGDGDESFSLSQGDNSLPQGGGMGVGENIYPPNIDRGSQSDSTALNEYGRPGGQVRGRRTTTVNYMTMGGGGGGTSGAYQQSLFGFWETKATDGYVQQGWGEASKVAFAVRAFTLMDTYAKSVILLTVFVGAYFGVLEGVLSFLVAFGGRLIVLMYKRGRVLRKQQRKPRQKFRNSVRGVFTKRVSLFLQLKKAAVSHCTQIQAWFYEHLHEHPLARMRILTWKDGASPLYSRLHPRPREITIVTQASADRLPAIEAMTKSWGGVLCVAIYARTQAEVQELYPRLRSLHELIEAKGLCRLNICVAKEEGVLSDEHAMAALYPINAMRNVALSMATTQLVFILDADFVPSAGMHEALAGDVEAYTELLRKATTERQMFVVPAFEGIAQKLKNSEISQVTYPTEMSELREQWKDGSAKAFHCSHFPRGHMPTNYENFFSPSTLRPYSVQYREFYEPYTICARELIPPFDARFRYVKSPLPWQEPLLCMDTSRAQVAASKCIWTRLLWLPKVLTLLWDLMLVVAFSGQLFGDLNARDGYGLNKISHAYHCAAMGMKLSVLPQVFVYSLPHFKSQAWMYTFGSTKDPLQKLRILGLYRRFKSEIQRLQRVATKMEEPFLPSQLDITVQLEEPLLPPGPVNMHTGA